MTKESPTTQGRFWREFNIAHVASRGFATLGSEICVFIEAEKALAFQDGERYERHRIGNLLQILAFEHPELGERLKAIIHEK